MIIKKSNFWVVSVLFLGLSAQIFFMQGMEEGGEALVPSMELLSEDPSIRPADGTCYWDLLPYEIQLYIMKLAKVFGSDLYTLRTKIGCGGEGVDRSFDLVAFSPSGKEFRVVRPGWVWRKSYSLLKHRVCYSVLWSPDGNTIIRNFGGRVVIGNTNDGVRELMAFPCQAMAWSPSGEEIALATGLIIQICNLRSYSNESIRTGFLCSGVAYDPSGERIALADRGGRISIWDRREHTCLLSCDGALSDENHYCQKIVWGSIGKVIVHSILNQVRILSAQTGKLVRTLSHDDVVESLCCTPKEVITGLRNGMVNVWDGKSGQLVQTLSSGSEKVTALAYTPEGEILSGSDSVCVWRKMGRKWKEDSIQPIRSFIFKKKNGKRYRKFVNPIMFLELQRSLARAKAAGEQYIASPEELAYFNLLADGQKELYRGSICVEKRKAKFTGKAAADTV